MSKILQELEQQFNRIETKIEIKKQNANSSYTHETQVLNEQFIEKNLLEKYSNELNAYRDGLLKQTSLNIRLEMDEFSLEKNKTNNLDFKRGLVKPPKICIWQLIKKEFKFNKIHSPSKLIKYKFLLGLNQVIETSNESDDQNIVLEAMSLASQLGNLKIVKYLVENGADINAKAFYEYTPIIIACLNGRFDIVNYLAKNGADVNARDAYNDTALILASEKGHIEIVKCLVEYGADVNALDNHNRTALISAFEKGHFEIVKFFENESKSKIKIAELLLALRSGNLEKVKCFVEKDADPNSKRFYNNKSLIEATKYGHLEIVKYLVEHEADVNTTNKYKETPLIIATKNGDLEVVRYSGA
jgi:ankyrin repeat protein